MNKQWDFVDPFYNFDQKKNTFHLVSSAGHLRYKIKDEKFISEFRNKHLNRFHLLCGSKGNKKAFYRVYRVIRRDIGWWSVSYRKSKFMWVRYLMGI